ncbi:hypothetical protein XO12_03830 [Marinitoga sp. 1154]|uniref:type I-B CRISPR-associated protein Cas5 n=1 Tax=Marinitoga sp. 1154 TaxID=1643335 RepID=UPI001586B57E|nr:type I-B CRISPR-associated protein Cas5 [Marinitoga sp. 1154]NUU99261.1 hypothetical protein [Marinitoga sp. 1154]
MKNNKLISFIINSNMGFLKKPDINDSIYLTFNMLHKPVLLGILGAIAGLEGFKKGTNFPEYYNELQEVLVGIEPINHKNGYFQKTVIKYSNTTGFANEGENKKGTNLLISEQTLLKPSYKIYVLLDLRNKYQKKLYNYIKEQKAEYLPYLGKNDYPIWWTEFIEYSNWKHIDNIEKAIEISTIFIKGRPLKEINENENENFDLFDFSNIDKEKNYFAYFERLPVKYDEVVQQYEYKNFVFTNFKIKFSKDFIKSDIYKITYNDNNIFISLF